MKPLKLIGILIIAILTSLAAPTGVWAKKGGKPGGGDGTDAGNVSMRATGVVDALQDCVERIASDDTSYLCNKGGNDHYILLGDFLINRNYSNGTSSTCFGAGYFPVTIGVEVNRDTSATTVLRFHGFENDGETDVLYVLEVTDPSGWSGPFPPAVGHTTTMGVLQEQSVSWVLRTGRKSQANDACVDSGTFVSGDDFIKVDFTRID